jgi:hypothetical protein
MKKEFKLVYILISIIPVIVLFLLYSSLNTFVNTKIFGQNGMIVSKSNFIFIIIALSLIWYYLSALFSIKISTLNSNFNQNIVRVAFNLFFSILSILLIISNV